MTRRKAISGRRKRAGRKRQLEGGYVTTFYLDTATLDKIDTYCRQLSLSRSEAVRRMVCLAFQAGERKGEQ